jgi:hypothetical protein
MAARTCADCGESIADLRPNAKYCGPPCRARASRKRLNEALLQAEARASCNDPLANRTEAHDALLTDGLSRSAEAIARSIAAILAELPEELGGAVRRDLLRLLARRGDEPRHTVEPASGPPTASGVEGSYSRADDVLREEQA